MIYFLTQTVEEDQKNVWKAIEKVVTVWSPRLLAWQWTDSYIGKDNLLKEGFNQRYIWHSYCYLTFVYSVRTYLLGIHTVSESVDLLLWL